MFAVTRLLRINQIYNSNWGRESLLGCRETLADHHLLFRSCTGYWNAIKSMVQFAGCNLWRSHNSWKCGRIRWSSKIKMIRKWFAWKVFDVSTSVTKSVVPASFSRDAGTRPIIIRGRARGWLTIYDFQFIQTRSRGLMGHLPRSHRPAKRN